VVLTVAAALLVTPAGADEQSCEGEKVLHAGRCRTAEEIAKLEEHERKQADAQRKRDLLRCEEAKLDSSASSWRSYLLDFPEGQCSEAARARIAELEAAAKAAPAEPQLQPGPEQPPAGPEQPQAEEGDLGLPAVAWGGFGVAAVGLALWAVTGSISLAQSESLKEDCSGGHCPEDLESDLDTARSLAHVATIGFVVAVTGSAVGVIALLTAQPDDSDSAAGADATGVSLRPLIGPGFVGLGGRF